jgi:acetyl esterase/lipase
MRQVFAIAVAGATLGCGPESRTDVVYDDRFGDDTKMDVYLPDGDGPRPGVMLIHGGAWIGGNRSEYTEAAKRLARSGYVAATIEYRLVPKGDWPKDVQDCVCALAWLRKHAAEYKLDPKRVAVWGYSAGGHLASLVGVAAEYKDHVPDCATGPTGPPAAVVSGAGGYDFHGAKGWLFDEYLGGSEDEAPDRWAAASPIHHVGPGKPPFLIVAGTADVLSSNERAHAMKDALSAAGNDATILDVAGGGHLLNASTDPGTVALEESDLTPEAWMAVMDFLARTIGRP